MLDNQFRLNRATEFRYTLDVIEEYSHLGLDDEAASKLRGILLRRIDEAEEALSAVPRSLSVFPVQR